MKQENAKLVELTADLKTEFLRMAEEYRDAGESRYQEALDDFENYLERLRDFAAGVNLPPDRVPATSFFLLSGGKMIGRSDLRHRLSPGLEILGGHIGYDVRPSERRKGYGTMILKLALEKARNIGLERVFITCNADNVASAKIIEKNGGVLEKQIIYDKTGKLISQYWIEL